MRRVASCSLLKRIGVGALLSMLTCATLGVVRTSVAYRQPSWVIAIAGGALFIELRALAVAERRGLDFGTAYSSWEQFARNWSYGGRFRVGQYGPMRIIVVPLWIPFVALAIPTAFLWRLDRRRPAPGECPNCNYNLTGNTTRICPECGQPVERAA